MKYTEVTLNTLSSNIDETCARLEELGVSGFVVEDEKDFKDFLDNNKQYWDYVDKDLEDRYKGISRIKFYLSENDELLETIRDLYPDIETKTVQDSDWEKNWKEFYKPIDIGPFLTVVPEWEELPDSSRIPLVLDPGLIFGTGSHPTTKMCLEAIQQYDVRNKNILDLGCGSGILGIGTLVLGAEKCVGVDIDPKAVDVVMSNAALNDIHDDRMKVYAGNVLTDTALIRYLGSGYDIVLANIVADVIIPLSSKIKDFLKVGGIFITSGIIDGRENEVEKELISNGFRILEHKKSEEWNAFICT